MFYSHAQSAKRNTSKVKVQSSNLKNKSPERLQRCFIFVRGLNIPGFRVCQVSAYGSVAQGSEYSWKWLNNALLWQSSEYA